MTELAEPFAMSLPAISKHLKVLEHANLISRGREAQWRPCRIAPAVLKDVDGWLERYRKFWGENFDRLDDYLQEMKAQEANGKPPKPDEVKAEETRPQGLAAPAIGSRKGESPWTQKSPRL